MIFLFGPFIALVVAIVLAMTIFSGLKAFARPILITLAILIALWAIGHGP